MLFGTSMVLRLYGERWLPILCTSDTTLNCSPTAATGAWPLGLAELAASAAAWPYPAPVARSIRQTPTAATIDRTVPLLPNQSVSITFRVGVALLYCALVPNWRYDVNCNACSTWNGRRRVLATRSGPTGHLVDLAERVFATLQ